MNVLVINGSPYMENSTTLKITRKFLEGMEETAEIVNTAALNVEHCHACYSCWTKTKGKCVINDKVSEVLQKMRKAELIIWSVPLYCYSAPSHCKALMDRTLCFNSPLMYTDKNGISHHYGYEEGTKKVVLISSGGLPDVKGNFDGLVFQLKHMFGENTATVLCAESSLFLYPETEKLTYPYLETVKKAGAEYKANGKITEETQKILDTPMIPKELYIKNSNAAFSKNTLSD